MTVLKNLDIEIDVVAGSVTDSQMGEDFVEENYCIKAETLDATVCDFSI